MIMKAMMKIKMTMKLKLKMMMMRSNLKEAEKDYATINLRCCDRINKTN
jgi:hypothetical protein